MAVRGRLHFHGSTEAEAQEGLRKKRHSRILRIVGRPPRRIADTLAEQEVNFTDRPIGAILRSVGFCTPGVADALDMLGLDDRTYSWRELIREANWNKLPCVAHKYPEEVAAVARALTGVETRDPVRAILRLMQDPELGAGESVEFVNASAVEQV